MYDFKGKSDWQGGHPDTSDYGYPDNGVFFGKISKLIYHRHQRQPQAESNLLYSLL